MNKKIVLLFIVAITVFSCLFPLPALAQTIALYPSMATIDEMPLGGSARAIFSIENNLKETYLFKVSAGNPFQLDKGYANLPDLKWISFEPDFVELVPGGSRTIMARISLPADENLNGQKYQVEIRAASEEPKMTLQATLFVLVGQTYQPPAKINWMIIIAGVLAVLAVGIAIIKKKGGEKNEKVQNA